ncbi:tryptophan 7-halogenase, partial [Halomonas sp. 328]|uniref:tryptophan 7-halogenase n=1 Tax=Halomonas sp. 328 TaxID=2776704 RepID=UPI001E655631
AGRVPALALLLLPRGPKCCGYSMNPGVNGSEVAWPLLGYGGDHIPDNSPFKRFVNEGRSVEEVVEYLRLHDSSVRFGYHFDAKKVAAYFKEIALSKGVFHIDGNVSDVEISPCGKVRKLLFKEGGYIEPDFVVDCSGMRRAVSSKLHGFKYNSFDHLLVDRAIGFFLPHELTGFSLLTDAIAMKHGWMWVIPTKDRSGCGYVFSSQHCDENLAKLEVEEYFGTEIDVPISHSFKSGVQQEVLSGNVLSVGLCAGFVEPLEATSIGQTISQLNDFSKLVYENGYLIGGRGVDRFNGRVRDAFFDIAEFIHMHYLGGRVDTEFWRDIKEKAILNPGVKGRLGLLSERLPRDVDSKGFGKLPQLYFSEFSYFSVYRELGLITDCVIEREMGEIDSELLGEMVEKINEIISGQHVSKQRREHEVVRYPTPCT